VNGELDKLFVNLLDGIGITLFEKVFQCIGDIVVVNKDGAVMVVFHLPEIDGIFVVDVLEDVNFFLKDGVLLLIFVVNDFLNQDLFVLNLFLFHLAEWKLACLHINYGI
jgi:hypothetical protein